MSFNRLSAPFNGRITLRNTDVGDLVTAGVGHELFRLADTSKLRVFIRVPQSMAFNVSTGQTADLFLPEKPGEHFTAVVTRTAGAIDAMSRTLLTELEVDNHEDKLFAGSFAQVRLEALRRSQLLTIPANALVFRQDGMQIAVVDTNNKVELRNFKPGRDLGYRLEVTEGVSANDRIILNPPDSLTAGVTVRLAPPSTGSKETK
jgi:RND family efflux transporter MFP subunit